MKIIKVNKKTKEHDIAINMVANNYDSKNRGENYWFNRFDKTELDYIGYLLVLNNNYIGFMGVIGSKEIIGLSVWYVELSQRKFSLPFVSLVMKDLSKNAVVNSSPNPIALKIFSKLYGFVHIKEYVGIPKSFFGFSKKKMSKLHIGNKINVCYSDNISIIELFFISLRHRKICVALVKNPKLLIKSKTINVLYRNLEYSFPLSIKGDIYE